MNNPLDQYLMEKTGGVTKTAAMRDLRQGMGQALGNAVIGGAATVVGVAGLKAYRALRKTHDFRSMMEHNPDLAEYHEQNPTQFNAHYNSFRSVAPSYAEDPIIAGTFMRQMSESPVHAGGKLLAALESHSKVSPRATTDYGPAKLTSLF